MFARLFVTSSLLVVAVAGSALAQTPPAPAQPPAAAPAQPPAPPVPGMGGFVGPGQTFWTRSITLGGSFTSSPFVQGNLGSSIPGLTGEALGLQGQQRALQTSLNIMRSTNLHSVNVAASFTYAVVEPVGKVMDLPKVSVDYDFRQKDGQRYFFLTHYAWYKDSVRHVDYSHQGFVGVGLLALDAKKAKIGLVPVLGVIREKKGLAEFDDRWLAGWGGIQRLILTPNPFVKIEQRASFQQAFNDSAFRVFESNVNLKGQINKHLATSVDITYKYDNVLALAVAQVPIPGVGTVPLRLNNKHQVLMTAGIQITF
jgi:hypothetical protein